MKSAHIGTHLGDRHIEEAENDPNIKLMASPDKMGGSGDEASSNSN